MQKEKKDSNKLQFGMKNYDATKMHPINKMLFPLGIRITRTSIKQNINNIGNDERNFREKYDFYYKEAENNRRGFKLFKDFRYEAGEHPCLATDILCEFTAYHLHKAKPIKILDIGSFRKFLLGVLAHYDITTLDVRNRKSLLDNETVVTCDAKALTLSDDSFDFVMCLGSIYCFGLGRYGDEFDLDADIKGFNEMVRVLKPGGLFVFSMAIGNAHPSIYFNRCRICNYEMIQERCDGLECVEEKLYSRRLGRYCSKEELTYDTNSNHYDDYMGCWRKK